MRANLFHVIFNIFQCPGGDSGLRVDDVVISGSLDISNVQGRPLLQALLDQGIQVQFEQQGLTSPPPYPGKMFVIGEPESTILFPFQVL